MKCSEFLAVWVDAHADNPLAGPLGSGSALLEAHTNECEPCAEFVQRLRIGVGLLSTLENHPAPALLDGLVEAQIQPDSTLRAARALDLLGPLQAPKELTQRLAQDLAAAHRAPVILDKLVDQKLRNLPRAVNEDLLKRVDTLSAPLELGRRVDADVRQGVPHIAGAQETSADRPRRPALVRSLPARAALVAAMTLVVWGLWLQPSAKDATILPMRDFDEVVRHDSPEAFRAAAPRSVLNAATRFLGSSF